jgi:hypothetical protein
MLNFSDKLSDDVNLQSEKGDYEESSSSMISPKSSKSRSNVT